MFYVLHSIKITCITGFNNVIGVIMKRILILIMFPFYSIFPADNKMSVVYFNSFPPYSWEDSENKVMNGLLIDLLDEIITKNMGIELEHKGFPWKRAQIMVKTGEADAFVTLSTPKRLTYAESSTEYVLTRKITIFTKKDHPKIEEINNIKSLKELKKFKQINYIGNGWIKKNMSDFEIKLVPKFESVFLMIANERGDYTINNSHVSKHLIKKLNLTEEIVEIPIELDVDHFYLFISKKSDFVNILPDFDIQLKKTIA